MLLNTVKSEYISNNESKKKASLVAFTLLANYMIMTLTHFTLYDLNFFHVHAYLTYLSKIFMCDQIYFHSQLHLATVTWTKYPLKRLW